jgi:DNA (cytosine-5)-methyltransferase 1
MRDSLCARGKRLSNVQKLPRYTAGELFCGAGGLSCGFHHAGFSPIFANDVWDVALQTFLANFEQTEERGILPLHNSIEDLHVKDILGHVGRFDNNALEAGDLDVLLGGPPCQGFSLNSHLRSADDPRNYLFRHYVRLLHGLSPKIFVLENVPGMLSLEGGAFLEELMMKIRRSHSSICPGYEVEFRILNAAHYGVPQERFRIVVVGTRRDVSDKIGNVALPAPVHFSLAQAHFKGGRSHTFHYAIGYGKRQQTNVLPVFGAPLIPPTTVESAIGDLPPLQNGGGADYASYVRRANPTKLSGFQRRMRNDSKVLRNHWCRELLPPNTERVKHIPVGGDWRSIPRKLLSPGMQRALKKDHTTRYGRLSPDGIAGTLLTKPDPHWGTFLHYDLAQQRLISVREAARLQSFPDCHTFYGSQVDQYRLCGNAVPPLMAEAVAREVRRILDLYYQEMSVRRRVVAGAKVGM